MASADRPRTEYFRLDEQDALLPEIQPDCLEELDSECLEELDAKTKIHSGSSHKTEAFTASTAGEAEERRLSVKEPVPCFAAAVAAAVAATKADEAGGPIQYSGFETPREHQSYEISSKPLMLPAVGNAPLGSCEYFTPRSVKPNFNGALNDGFFTPRDGATQCATPETPRMNPHSPEWTSCASRRAPSLASTNGRISAPGPVSMNGSPADGSLLVKNRQVDLHLRSEDSTAWHGWQLQATPRGTFYYYHPDSGARQWEVPSELMNFLGDWHQVKTGDLLYWSNEQLGASCWKDPRHCASIHQAALDGNLAYLQLYLFANGSIDAVNSKGRSALHNACAAGQTEVITLLLSHQANVQLPDYGLSTPLHWACRYGHAAAVQLLLQAGADPDASNMLGDTPAHEAAAVGQVNALKQLMEVGANLQLQNAESRKASEVAALRGWHEVRDLLEQGEQFESTWSEEMTSERWQSPMQMQERLNLHEFGEPVSPALKLVRAARPVLRGVQWLANKVLGERPVNFKHGGNSSLIFDSASGLWLEPDDAVSEASEESEDSWWPERPTPQQARWTGP